MADEPMTYDEALAHLTADGTPELTARNVLLTALKGQSAWLGGWHDPRRLVHETGRPRGEGYRVLADGFAIKTEA